MIPLIIFLPVIGPMTGAKLAHEITRHLRTGGMRGLSSTDSKLARSVAIKFLFESVAHDTARIARFRHEARTLASLNHPNIAAIHAVEELGGRHFRVMELVPREKLAERLTRGSIPLNEAVAITTDESVVKLAAGLALRRRR